ncbi:hypothetical protein [Devosia sp. DBB001]|nr:hypothetical protein [Devosia sp. DBB001]
MENKVIYLIGHYGVGKLTIAREICAQTDARLFDNHLINNVIFSLIRADGKTPLPERTWELIQVIRDQAVAAITELAPAEASYVLTNFLADDEIDRAVYLQMEDMARRRGSAFVPVALSATDEAHAQRIASPDREERLKHTDAASAERVRREVPMLRFAHPNRLDLETTNLSPREAAQAIIRHAEQAQP